MQQCCVLVPAGGVVRRRLPGSLGPTSGASAAGGQAAVHHSVTIRAAGGAALSRIVPGGTVQTTAAELFAKPSTARPHA